jgi:hypothetical protein
MTSLISRFHCFVTEGRLIQWRTKEFREFSYDSVVRVVRAKLQRR